MLAVVMRFLTLLFLLLGISANAGIVYFKPTGTGSANGSTAANAVGRANVMATANAGDLLIMCGTGFTSSLQVTKNDIKIFAADVNGVTNKWSADIAGSTGEHAIYTATGVTGCQIWGVKFLSSYIDCIKFNGDTNTVRGCWISGAGRSTGWSTNNNGSFSGQGVGFHGYNDITIEENVFENNGAYVQLDHHLYGAGKRITIRGNVFRNGTAWGIQAYDSVIDNDQWVIAHNLIYANGVPGISASGLTFWTLGNVTNWIYGNTIIAPSGHYGVIINQANASAQLYFSNNIVEADAAYGVVYVYGAGGTNSVKSDYNLLSSFVSGEPRGANDIAGTATFDSTANGRYWLTSASAGRNAAATAICNAKDFFGRAQSSVNDIGAFQYEASLEADSRNLTDTQRDYWVREPSGILIAKAGSTHLLSWTEQNQHHVQYEITRKDSVNNTYAALATVNKGTLTYSDPGPMTNGVTYTYSMAPVTSLGNGGGIGPSPAPSKVFNASTLGFRPFRF